MSFRKSLLPVVLLFIFASSCNTKSEKIPAFNRSYAEFINSFTSGVISKKSSVNVYFNRDVNTESTADFLTFSPAIEGEVVWVSSRHLQFIPNEDLEPSEIYRGKLELNHLLDVPDSLNKFTFGFKIIEPDFDWGEISLNAVPANQMRTYQLKGSLLGADEAELDELRELLSATAKGKVYNIRWFNSPVLRKYEFVIDSINRGDEGYNLTISQKSESEKYTLADKDVEIPALGDFKYVGYDVVLSPEREITVKFSDPLKPNQDLTGLITLEGEDNLNLTIDNTQIRFTPSKEIYGTRQLRVFQGIQNIEGYKFKGNETIEIDFASQKPQVQVLAKGNIMPQGDKVLLPFKAISLNAVDIKVVKVPQINILQFLQTNNIEGDRELYRVGQVVARKKIDLTEAGNNLTNWANYAVNLADLVKTEPGALYKVYFSFRKEYSEYPACDDFNTQENSITNGYYYDYYDYYDDYYDYSDRSAYDRSDFYFTYPNGYTWRERDNPCHTSYYNQQRFSTHNVLVSDLGVTAKNNDNNQFDITVTHLKTTEPISDAEVNLYSYQQQLLISAKTDADGFTKLNADKKRPYFLEVKKGNQRNYLKVNDGYALSLSAFEVGGEEVKKGLKGFIYGERGVWRPGDSLFLNFMLQNEAQDLPKGHPVVFELTNPQGALVDRQVATTSIGRIYDFTSYTHPKAVTGNYTAKVKVGGVSFTKRVKIETVKPNRLEIDMELGDKPLNIQGEVANVPINVEWLTGLEAANTKLKIDATVVTLANPFEKYKDFTFNDPAKNFSSLKKEVFEGTTAEDGTTQAELNVGSLRYAPGMLKARFVVKAFEAGGDFSTEYFDAKLAPYDRFVGVKLPQTKTRFLKTDKNQQIEIRTLDENGKPMDVQNLEVKVYKVDWHWWYDASNNYLNRYINNEATHLYSKGTVSTVNGKATYNLEVKYPAWGRFLVRVCDGQNHCGGSIAYFDWPDGVGEERPEITGATVLNFSPEKDKYSVGEEVVTKIPVSGQGRVLVTLENGTEILKKEWVDATDKKEITYTFKAEPEMAPNVYLAVSYFQPHGQNKNDRPVRLYGVTSVQIVNDKSVLKPKITAADVWRPEQKVEVKVSEANGRKMSYTLAVVDEGLLNLTRFGTPDPWKHFYAKEGLGIKTFDMFNYVLGAFSGKLAQIFAVGGDAALNNKGLNNQNRFKPMVRHLGPFTLEAGEKANHSIQLPNYIGKVKVMVVAAADEAAYGNVEKSVHIRKPLMVLSSLPRTFSPEEEVTLPVTVFAMEETVKNVTLTVKASGGVEVMGSSNQKVSFTKVGQKVVDFKLKIPKAVGQSTIRIDAKSGSETAYDETQMVIRAPNPPFTQATSFYLKAGADTTLDYMPVGLPQTNEMYVTAYGMPDFHLQERLKYLFGYPHGCAEQTVSRVFPLIYLDKVMDLTESMKREREQNLRIAFDKIYRMQTSAGGVKYWPSSSYGPNQYVTTYAGSFIYEAKQLGYEVPSGFLPRFERFQKSTARSWSAGYSYGKCYNCLDQAYRLRVMAEHGYPEVGAMNRLKEERLSRVALWNLAGAYAFVNQKETALALIEQANNTPEPDYYYYYGSSLRNMAMQLEVYNNLGEDQKAFELAQQMCRDLNGNNYYATHSLALGLKSVIKYFTTTQTGKSLGWAYRSDGLQRTFSDPSSISSVEQKKGVDGDFEFTVSNRGNAPLNFTLTRVGTPLRSNENAQASGLRMRVTYEYPNGGTLDVNTLKQGQDFVAKVWVARTGDDRRDYTDLALTQIFPSGWEIINTRLTNESEQSDTEEGEDNQTQPEYQDIRDDRVYTYFDLQHKSEATFKIQLNATYAGKYYLPPVLIEAMYNNDIQAKSASDWVEVVR